MIKRIQTGTLAPYATESGSKILVIPVGGAGSGKSSALRELFPTAETCDPDAWKKLHPLYTDENPGGPEGSVHRWSVEQSVMECLEMIASAVPVMIYDTTGGTVERVRLLVGAARAAGYRVVFVKVWTPESVAWQRNLKRSRTVHAEPFQRTHAKVRRVWGELLSLCDSVVHICRVGAGEAPARAAAADVGCTWGQW